MTLLTRWTAPALLLGLTLTAQAEDSETQLFDQLDKNKDGVVTADEVSEAQSKAFQRLLRVGDGNEDGKLSREEFTKTLTEPMPAVQPQPDRNPGGPGQFQPGEMFNRLDRNGDGKVTLEEVPAEFRDRLKPVFERLGKDSVTREEFARLAAMRGDNPPGTPGRLTAEQAKGFFARLDEDKDGKVSLKNAPERARPFLQNVWKNAGKGEDAQLTEEEFVKAVTSGPALPPAQPQTPRPQPGAFTAQFVQRVLQDNDKNGDKKLSREEAPERMQENFDRIDANKDGFADEQELTAAMQRLQRANPGNPAANPNNPNRPRRPQQEPEKKPE